MLSYSAPERGVGIKPRASAASPGLRAGVMTSPRRGRRKRPVYVRSPAYAIIILPSYLPSRLFHERPTTIVTQRRPRANARIPGRRRAKRKRYCPRRERDGGPRAHSGSLTPGQGDFGYPAEHQVQFVGLDSQDLSRPAYICLAGRIWGIHGQSPLPGLR